MYAYARTCKVSFPKTYSNATHLLWDPVHCMYITFANTEVSPETISVIVIWIHGYTGYI